MSTHKANASMSGGWNGWTAVSLAALKSVFVWLLLVFPSLIVSGGEPAHTSLASKKKKNQNIILPCFSHSFLKDRKVTHIATSGLSSRRTGGKEKLILVFMGGKKIKRSWSRDVPLVPSC